MTDEDFKKIKKFINGDGCTGVPDFFSNGCAGHDWMYRTHRDFYGRYITSDVADKFLKNYIQSKSWFGKYSPMAWWRYYALKKVFGRRAWEEIPKEVREVN